MSTTTVLIGLTLFLVAILFVAVAVLLILQLRKPQSGSDASNFQTQIALIDEKVSRLEPATQAIQTSLTGELAKVQQGLAALDSFVKARQEIERAPQIRLAGWR